MSITLSKEYGVNPTIPKCFFCQKDKNEVWLLGAYRGGEAPQGMVWNKEPCDECIEMMVVGIILISVKDGEVGENPYRTGGWVVVKEDVIKRLQLSPKELETSILKERTAFIPDEAWDFLGLPRGEVEDIPKTWDEAKAKEAK